MLARVPRHLFFLSCLFAILIIAFELLPASMGGFYHSQAISCIYLPDLGQEKSIFGYLALMRVLYLLSEASSLTITHIASVISYFIIFLSYSLLFSRISGDKHIKTFVILGYSIIFIFLSIESIAIGYISGFSLSLSLIFFFFLINQDNYENYTSLCIIAIISWIALSIYWHTIVMMTYIIFLFYTFCVCFEDLIIYKKIYINWVQIILITVIFIYSWIYLRESTIQNAFQNININIDFIRIFERGSHTGTYNFKYTFPIKYIELIRIFGYVFSYFLLITILIDFLKNVFKKVKNSNIHIAIVSLIISEITFNFLYYISTGLVGFRVLITVTYPILLMYLNSSSRYAYNTQLIKIITIFLMIPLCITSISTVYTYISDSPEKNIYSDIYIDSFFWIVNNTFSQNILSDSHTTGHYQILYTSNYIYKIREMSFQSISYAKYKSILDKKYKNINNIILVINVELYQKHLVFRSLESWNKFEPLSPSCVIQNNQLNVVYNDGRVLIAQ